MYLKASSETEKAERIKLDDYINQLGHNPIKKYTDVQFPFLFEGISDFIQIVNNLNFL